MDYIASAEFRDRFFHIHAKDARIDRPGLMPTACWAADSLAYAEVPGDGRRGRWGGIRRLAETGH